MGVFFLHVIYRYMCSRFFIDFPDIATQTIKLESYLRNHFWGADEEPLQYQYLMHLRDVVEISTVCLMGHERRQTLSLIETLAMEIYYREHQKTQQQIQQQIQTQPLFFVHGEYLLKKLFLKCEQIQLELYRWNIVFYRRK